VFLVCAIEPPTRRLYVNSQQVCNLQHPLAIFRCRREWNLALFAAVEQSQIGYGYLSDFHSAEQNRKRLCKDEASADLKFGASRATPNLRFETLFPRRDLAARVAHSDAPGRSERSGEPEWSLRNGGCVGGLPCEDGNEGRGEIRKRVSAGMIEWKPRPIRGSSVCRRFRLLIWGARNCSNAI
jgi:hypothetical protein